MKFAAVVVLVVAILAAVHSTPLDDYIQTPDPVFGWNIVSTIKGGPTGHSYTGYVMNMTSQSWLTPNDTDSHIWRHWLVVCVPDKVQNNKAFMYIDGGHTHDGAPTSIFELITNIAEMTGSISVHLMQIPNEPIVFTAEGKSRSEDAIIAYTWNHYINDPSDPYWLVRLPMVKAAVRALDAVEQFVQTLGPSGVPPITGWGIAGASKRGWVTWLMGAVDKRVIAIVPLVMDIPNMVKNMGHQWEAYGNWSFALEDYRALGLMGKLNDPSFQTIADIEDPYVYFNRLTMPKYMICACGDEFFLPDSPSFFYGDLSEPKQMWMIPDAEHSLAGHVVDVGTSVATFWWRIVYNQPRPIYSWTITSEDNSTYTITVTTDTPAAKARMYHAHNPWARDFRLITNDDPIEINPIFWIEEPIENSGKGTQYVYQAQCVQPVKGWRSCQIEITYSYGTAPFTEAFERVSTEVVITPNILPYPPCGDHCA